MHQLKTNCRTANLIGAATQYSFNHTTIRQKKKKHRNPSGLRWHDGASDGNRTHATSLEGWDSTIELHSHIIGEHLNYSTKRVICQYVLSKIITTYRKISPRLLIFCRYYVIIYGYAGVMELADVTDSKSVGSNTVRVRPPPPAPN